MSDTLWRLLSPEVFAVSTFGLAATMFVVGGGRAALLVAVVGWFLLTPLSTVLRELAEDTPDAETSDPVERLRERYADGEIDDVEFERQLEALLATEDADPETAHERLQDRSGERRTDTDDLSELLDDSETRDGGDETGNGEREVERE
jgi:uncharacterized membrane protein